MKSFFALFIARTKEFYRDKGSLAWAIIFPIMAIIGCTVAFSNDHESLFKIGLINAQQVPKDIELLKHDFNNIIFYNDKNKALQRIRQHQLHILIDIQHHQFWINPQSSQGLILKQLLLYEQPHYHAQNLSGKAVRYVDWVLPGILGMNIMFGAIFGVGYVIVRYRKNGVLRRLKATPINALQFLSAQIFSRLIIILSANITIFIAAIHLLNLTMLGSYVDLFIITFLGATAMISIGMLISARTDSEELAGGLLNLITWPMMFLSSVWFSLDNAPRWLQSLAEIFPLTHLVRATREIMLDGASLYSLSYEIFMLTAASLVFLLLGAYFFHWHKE